MKGRSHCNIISQTDSFSIEHLKIKAHPAMTTVLLPSYAFTSLRGKKNDVTETNNTRERTCQTN
jgi:hypothetical protein